MITMTNTDLHWSPTRGRITRIALFQLLVVATRYDLAFSFSRLGAYRRSYIIESVHSKNERKRTIFQHFSSKNAAQQPSSSSSRKTRFDIGQDSQQFYPNVTDIASRTSKTQSTDWMLLPWLPTRRQIESLNLVGLCNACTERGLARTGKKEELQKRLLQWTQQQHYSTRERKKAAEPDYYHKLRRQKNNSTRQHLSSSIMDYRVLPFNATSYSSSSPKQKKTKTLTSKADYLQRLTETFQASPYSKSQLKQMYLSAKQADQRGDIQTSKQILKELLQLTPQDGRILRRLARLEQLQGGDLIQSRNYLLQGTNLQEDKDKVYFYHALGILEKKRTNYQQARHYFQKAIQISPTTIPNAYHAWSRMEYSQGNIKLAVSLLKRGLHYFKTNHRFYHELGNLYRDAGLFSEAQKMLLKGLEYCPENSKSFFYTSLSYVFYELHGYDKARIMLLRSVHLNPLHSQGWLALAQLDESEGYIEKARKVYTNATSFYQSFLQQRKRTPNTSTDKWYTVYQSWGRMEQTQALSPKTNSDLSNFAAMNVYQNALHIFPHIWDFALSLAQITMQMKKKDLEITQQLFELACNKAAVATALPYQQYAEFEASFSNFERARSIYLLASQRIFHSYHLLKDEASLYHLLHSWAKLEMHLQNHDNALSILEKILKLTTSCNIDETNSIRRDTFKTMAQLHYEQHNYYIAQHCVAQVFLHDNHDESDKKDTWILWSQIAKALENDRLEQDCLQQASKDSTHNYYDFAGTNKEKIGLLINKQRMKKVLGKAPWHRKLFH